MFLIDHTVLTGSVLKQKDAVGL